MVKYFIFRWGNNGEWSLSALEQGRIKIASHYYPNRLAALTALRRLINRTAIGGRK